MANKVKSISPKLLHSLEVVGNNLKYARLRRDLSMETIAQRADISRATLQQIEAGSPSVCIGSYLEVLSILGMEEQIELVGAGDPLGRLLQDIKIKPRGRATKNKGKIIYYGNE